jgi:hypothetical protein
MYDSTRPSAYNNLVLLDPLPQREFRPVEVMEFGEPDHGIFPMERWPLCPIPTAVSDASALQFAN